MSKIVPWRCHICSGEFSTEHGGLCQRCNRPACLLHLGTVTNDAKYTKISSEQPKLICSQCLFPEETLNHSLEDAFLKYHSHRKSKPKKDRGPSKRKGGLEDGKGQDR